MADLSGSWLGTFWQHATPTRFEATLLHGGNSLSGHILDDGPGGEATLKGAVVGRRVSFIKRYIISDLAAIHYTGTLSEDGNFIQGEWQIGKRLQGNWEATRTGDNLTLVLKGQQAKQQLLTLG